MKEGWMKQLVIVCGLLGCCAYAAVVSAQRQRGFMAYGPVDVSCGGLLSDTREEYRWWVMGFVSGAGREFNLKDGDLAKTDTKAIDAWIVNYCRSNPLDTIEIATIKLVDELKARAAPRP
jgi:hypothetical protein